MFGLKLVRKKDLDAINETLTRTARTLEDIGWINLSLDQTQDNSLLIAGGFERAILRSRVFYFNNPLAGHWCNLTTWFVFGEGIAMPTNPEKDVQEEIEKFWTDPDNQMSFTSFQAQQQISNKLQYEGNLFFLLFDDEEGNVKVRFLNTTEVADVIRDQSDRMRTMFYKVKFRENKFNFTDGTNDFQDLKMVFYADKDNVTVEEFNIPANKFRDEARIFHVKINGDINDKYGVPDLFRGLDWMEAHKNMAGDLATLIKALSQFAWKKKIKGTPAQVNSIAAALNSKIDLSNIRNSAARTQVENEALNLEAMKIPTGGVSIGKDGLRQMKLMVAAASGLFEHYYGDASTGNLATAKSMELPMVKKFSSYQTLWASIYNTVLQYMIDRKIEKGILSGKPVADSKNRRLTFKANFDRTIDIDFPPILEADVKASSEAWAGAKREGLVSDDLASERFMLDANIRNISDELKKVKATSDKKVTDKNNKEIKEAIDTPKKKMNRLDSKNNFLEEKINSFKKSISNNFKDLQQEIKSGIKTSSLEDGRTTGIVRDVETIIKRFGEKMKISARTFFPIAVQIGEKFMQRELKDIIPGINIADTVYEAQGSADGVLGERLAWNSQFIDESLLPAISESVNKAVKQSFGSEGEFKQAVNKSINKFEGRVSQYVGALWTVEETAVKEAGRNTDVLVNFVGPADEVSCPGCDAAVGGNPWPINEAPLPGEQQCLGNCRHALQVIPKEEGTDI